MKGPRGNSARYREVQVPGRWTQTAKDRVRAENSCEAKFGTR